MTDNYSAWKIKPVESLAGLGWREASRHLLGWGLLAPSSHNMQPWWVTEDGGKRTIVVWPRAKYMRGASDRLGRETYLSLGCFVSFLELALGSYGVKYKSRVVERENLWGVELDLVNLASGRLKADSWLKAMLNRRAYRGKYRVGQVVPRELVSQLQRVAKNHRVGLRLITNVEEKQTVAEIQELADRAVILGDGFRWELANYLRLSDTDEERVMPTSTFLLPDSMARGLIEALKASGPFPGSYADGFARNDFERMSEASVVGVVLVGQEHPTSWLGAGKALAEMWLVATRWGLGVGVTAGMVESLVHSKLLVEKLGVPGFPAAVFRLGKPLEIVPHAPRLRTVDRLFDPD